LLMWNTMFNTSMTWLNTLHITTAHPWEVSCGALKLYVHPTCLHMHHGWIKALRGHIQYIEKSPITGSYY
jgi:hypothetical protein